MLKSLRILRKKTLNRYTLLALICLGALWWGWTGYLAPTQVAVVNFTDFQYAQMLDANENRFIRIHRLEPEDLVDANLADYSATLVFGMGLHLSEAQLASARNAMSEGAKVFVLAHTSKESELTNISGDALEHFNDYTKNGGRKNTKRLFNYIRRVLDGKRCFSTSVKEAEIVPMDSLFHLDKERFFEAVAQYQAYYEEQGLYKKERPRVCLLTSLIGPRTSNRSYVDGLIERLEARNLNVYPVAGFMNRLSYLKEVKPDIAVYIPHGRLAMGQGAEAIAWLQERNIPLLCPLDVFSPYDGWLKSQQGMSGGMLSQSIVMPELDGGIEPFAIAAQFPDERGLDIPGGIPERLDTFVARIDNWLKLRAKPNSEKRIAIVYYKGPGRNAMVAGGLEVAPSVLRVLRELKKAGYTTGPLPETDEAFMERIQAEGPVLGPYAKGAFEAFLDQGAPELIPVQDYLAWVRAQLEPDLYAEVENVYGPAPGEYLSVVKEDVSYIALPRVRFGNVVCLPQMMAGLGEDTNKVVHGVKAAPPHPYLATYLWAKHGFKADALMHFGTHGSFEFTPWKQVALSQYDWADALIGDLPHPYLYVINNIGEAVIAKRRSYATIVSHLTPPFMESELYGPLMKLDHAVDGYINGEDEALRVQFEADIISGIQELDLHKDLGFDDFDGTALNPDMVNKLHNYLHTVAQEKITRGLYTVGVPYAQENVRETARLMAVDPISYSMVHLDVAKGKVDKKAVEELHDFSDTYRESAYAMIDQILAKEASPEDFIEAADLERIKAWDAEHAVMDEGAMMRAMMTLSDEKKSGAKDADATYDANRLQELFLLVAEKEKHFELLKDLKNEAQFERTAVVLDPAKLENARKLARFIPPMREAMETMAIPEVLELLTLMHQHPEAKAETLRLLEDPDILKKLRAKQAQARQAKVDIALSREHKEALFQSTDTQALREKARNWSDQEATSFVDHCSFYADNLELVEVIQEQKGADTEAVLAILRLGKAHLENAMKIARKRLETIEEEEHEYVEAVRTAQEALSGVSRYEEALSDATQAEIDGLLQAFKGGYIPPSTGGDPIGNPDSVPTGRNLSAIDMEKCPSPQAWKVGKKLAESIIQNKRDESGAYPKKVAVTLWGGELIRTEGAQIALVFHLLGVEPERNSRGVVHGVRLVPMEELGRPRIDVVVQTSGQARDIAASRIFLINDAVKLASEAKDPPEAINHVKEGSLAAERVMKERGVAPLDAQNFATARVFGGVNGNYGAAIMGLVESGDRWESDEEISDQYLNNMGALYTKEHWGHFEAGIFEGALQNTDTLAHSRSSNTWGPLSLDHVYEFMGGLNATIRNVTGNDPDAYFSDMRNKHNPSVQGAKEAIWTETRTTLMNPKYIGALQEGGASSAEEFAETFRNTYGWNVMKPKAIDAELWEGLYEVYVEDKYEMDMEDYFREKNPYALQEMSAVMLETIRKGYWEANQNTIEKLANLHAELVRDHEAGCSGFVCDNAKLRDMIAAQLNEDLRKEYNNAIDEVRIGANAEQVQGMTLEKEPDPVAKAAQLVRENPIAVAVLLSIALLLVLMVILGARQKES